MKKARMQTKAEYKPERRSSVRINAEIRVYYGACTSKLLTGYSIDLNTNGIFLVTTCPFDVDDNVRLKLFIPGQEEKVVSCVARVAWINHENKPPKPEYPAGVGLQFVDLAPEDLCVIEGFLEDEAAC
jgi:Tfp pilus assembly protein PilZ